MSWYNGVNKDGKRVAVWSEEYPGHHKIILEFDLQDLKQQLGLYEISEEVQ